MLEITKFETQTILLEADSLIRDLTVINDTYGYDTLVSEFENGVEIIAQIVAGFVSIALFIGNVYLPPMGILELEAVLVEAQPVYQNV